jgi:hypothetical protein
MATTTAAVPEAPQQHIGAFGRLIGAIVNPRPTFEDIARKPSWLVPILVMTVISIVLSVAINQRVDWPQVVQQRIEKSHFASQRLDQLPQEQRQANLELQAKGSRIFVYVRGVLGTTLLTLVLGGIYLGLFNLAGAGLTFGQSFSLVAYALLPSAIKDLLGIPIVLMKDPGAIDPQNFIASNLGALVSSDAAMWKTVLASSVDIFVLWSVVLVAVAFSAANPKKITFGKALTITLGVFIAFTLVITGITAMTS